MTQRIDIVNLALSWVGEQPITSIDDESERARIMKLNYDLARDATLEMEEWTFAIKRWVPEPLSTSPDSRYLAYPVPHDILRVLTVERGIGRPVGMIDDKHLRIAQPIQVDWQVEGNLILTNADSICCRGIRKMSDEGSFTPLFVNAFAARLAYQTAMALTNNAEIEDQQARRFMQYLNEAESRDGQQGRTRRIRNRSLRWAR